VTRRSRKKKCCNSSDW